MCSGAYYTYAYTHACPHAIHITCMHACIYIHIYVACMHHNAHGIHMLAGVRSTATSTASTVPAPNPETHGHEARTAEANAAATTAPSARPALLRVNSVPVLSPHTPAERIRHSGTPEALIPEATAAPPESATATEGVSTNTMSRQERKRLRREEKRELKRQRKAQLQQQQPDVNQPDLQPPAEVQAHAVQTTAEAGQAPGVQPAPVVPTAEQAAEATTHGLANGSTTSQSTAKAKQLPAPSAAPPAPANDGSIPKAAARKAAAKPHAAKPQQVKTEVLTPARTDDKDETSREQAARDNLQRASTASLVATPASTVPYDPSRFYDPDIEEARGAGADEDNADEDQGDDIEDELEREIDRDTNDTHAQGQPLQDTPKTSNQEESQQPGKEPQVPAPAKAPQTVKPKEEEEGTHIPKRRREKTPAEKAAHARYMRFTRSFDRFLVMHCI